MNDGRRVGTSHISPIEILNAGDADRKASRRLWKLLGPCLDVFLVPIEGD